METIPFLSGGGEMGALMRAHDWASTPLGTPDAWPQSLRTVVRLILNTNHPMYVFWGAQGSCLYNDAYRQSIGPERHPSSLGRPAREVWEEIWPVIGPQIAQVMGGGGATWYENALVPITRNGVLQDVYWTYSYSPIDDEGASGGIGGILVACTETTQQVKAARNLAAERERQERNFSQIPGFVAILSGPDHVFEYVNQAYRRISGAREFLGRTVREVFPELASQGFYELLDQVYASGRSFAANGVPLRLTDETADRFIDFVYEPNFDAERKVAGIFVGGYDVTEAHRSAQALRALNADLESQVIQRTQARGRTWQVTPDLMGALNAQGYFETSNPAWSTVLGWSEEEVARTSIWELLHPDDVERSRAGFNLTQVGEPAVRFPNRYRCKDGSYRWISWVGVPEDGLVYCTGRDVTEENSQAAELAARTAERDLLATLVESTDTMVMVVALNYDILGVNPANADAFERVYGVRPRVGDNMLDLLADQPEHQAQVRASWGRGLAGEEVTFVEEFGDPGRARAFYEVSFRTLRDTDGRRIGSYQFVRDVTQRHREQAALAEAQEQLRQAQKMEAIGQLTGGVAHDFNNLLTVISGSVELLMRDNVPEDRRRRYITAIADTAARAAKLTSQLLAFARRQALRPEVFDVGQSVALVSDMVATLTGSRIHIDTRLPKQPCFINADPSQFDTALVNMAVNARDAMDGEGRLIITVEAVSVVPAIRAHPAVSGDFVAVSLTDSGSGIPAGKLDQIFEPFFTTKDVGQGTGLGLSQVFGFTKQSGGEVAVTSQPGVGSTFTLYLPRAAPTAAATETRVAEPLVDGHGAWILVVEDNVDVGAFSTRTLEELGYRTDLAVDANEALEKLETNTHPFDAVFSDVVMPGMSGIELAQEIRHRHPALPVILTSGYSHVLAQDGSSGFELLQKPYSIEQLSRVLSKAAKS